MTVEQLIKKLSKLPKDAIITVANDEMFEQGEYIATGVVYWKEDNAVSIETDYSELLHEEKCEE